MQYRKASAYIIEQLNGIVGEDNVIVSLDQIEMLYGKQTQEKTWTAIPDVIVKAENSLQVSEIIKIANRERIIVTPAGPAGGAAPVRGGLVVSTERMNRILEIDPGNMYMVIEPGVTIVEVQKKARENNLRYAGDPFSAYCSFIEDSSATSSGVKGAFIYSAASRHICGLEVVMPTGEIIAFGGKTVKNIAMYDMVRLIAGSEGTLGIVTKIWLKLMPAPRHCADLLIPFDDMLKAIRVVPMIMTAGTAPATLDFMDQETIKATGKYLSQSLPHSDAAAYIICTVEAKSKSQLEEEYEMIGGLCLENGAMDAFVANSLTAREGLWKVRKCYAEAISDLSPVCCRGDIVVPMSSISRALEEIKAIGTRHSCRIISCGPAGNGNIQCTILKEDRDDEEWEKLKIDVFDEIYKIICRLGGSFSGELGTAAKWAQCHENYSNPSASSVMKSIKKALDPNLILNPDRIADLCM